MVMITGNICRSFVNCSCLQFHYHMGDLNNLFEYSTTIFIGEFHHNYLIAVVSRKFSWMCYWDLEYYTIIWLHLFKLLSELVWTCSMYTTWNMLFAMCSLHVTKVVPCNGFVYEYHKTVLVQYILSYTVKTKVLK